MHQGFVWEIEGEGKGELWGVGNIGEHGETFQKI